MSNALAPWSTPDGANDYAAAAAGASGGDRLLARMLGPDGCPWCALRPFPRPQRVSRHPLSWLPNPARTPLRRSRRNCSSSVSWSCGPRPPLAPCISSHGRPDDDPSPPGVSSTLPLPGTMTSERSSGARSASATSRRPTTPSPVRAPSSRQPPLSHPQRHNQFASSRLTSPTTPFPPLPRPHLSAGFVVGTSSAEDPVRTFTDLARPSLLPPILRSGVADPVRTRRCTRRCALYREPTSSLSITRQ